jgi:hypothetical protein
MSDDRGKRGLRLNGLTDTEIQAMTKASVAELSAQGFFFDSQSRRGGRAPRQNAADGARRRAAEKMDSGALVVTARAWAQPLGHADIAPSRYDRIEGDGYLTLDAPWVVPALLRSVPEISGQILEPAAGRGHISLELRRAGFNVVSRDIRRYLAPLVDGIGVGDIASSSRSPDSTGWSPTSPIAISPS